MSHSLFIADLHLTPDRPRASEQFFDFTSRIAPRARTLYVLGDLFEYWIGDDDLQDEYNASIADALRTLSDKGVAVHYMHGNRDVLAGQTFVQRCGATLLTDPTPVSLYDVSTLLMHGDTLCTDDVEYQKFRVYAHDAENQRKFLALPLAARRKQMLDWRAQSERSKQEKDAEIMDVSIGAVENVLRDHGYPRLIHGHTHRPARHEHVVDGRSCERWVLTDWYGRAGYLRCDETGCHAVAL